MKIFTVYIDKKAKNPVETATLVPETFSWAGLIFPINIVWSIFHRCWSLLGVIFLIEMGTFLVARWGILESPYNTLLRLPFIFALGLYANDFRRWSLEHRGYIMDSIVTGKDQVDAQLRYFETVKLPK